MPEKLQIHLDPCTVNSRKVLAGLELLKAPYEVVPVNYFISEQKSEHNVKLNPCATVPFAVVGDQVITESNAILQYAADVNNAEEYYPKDLLKRAIVNRWLFWESSVWFKSCCQSHYIYLFC